MNRRDFLAGVATTSLVGVFANLQARQALAAGRMSRSVVGPYGPLRPVSDLATGLPLLLLPEGFSYRTFSWAGDVLVGDQRVPALHDGMGVVHSERRGAETIITLIRNHECALDEPIQAPARYDTTVPPGQRFAPGGGTTTLRYSNKRWLSARPSLGGTFYNCAGGAAPWGSWFTCEETFTDLTPAGGKRHGYVFEVRLDTEATTGRPILDMGRMMHEAVAIDPATRYAYLTEDNPRCSTLYRFIPTDRSGTPGSFEKGGRLQAARVVGQPNTDLMTPSVGDVHRIEWVDIAQPDSNPGQTDVGFPGRPGLASGPFLQAWKKGALLISRGEGICHHNGKIYVVDTAAGGGERRGSGDGAVWEYDPAGGTLRSIFASGSDQVADNIDNITVSPRGGILLCEDADNLVDSYGLGSRVLGLTPAGESFAFAKNQVMLSEEQIAAAGKRVVAKDYRADEFAGACFDPAGTTLFFNIQTPGITFAVWGPWQRGTF